MSNSYVPTPEDIARVKGLGFLRDKTTPNCFNARVLTVNGRVSAEVMEAVAQASRRFGSGKVALTSRMTFEIQTVPYENIEPLRAFLAQYGLETGGTVTVLADLLGRVLLAPTEIPVGIMMALVGAPFFLVLLFWKRGRLR